MPKKMTSVLLGTEDRRLLERLATMEQASKGEIIRRAIRHMAEDTGLRSRRVRTLQRELVKARAGE